ncbi:MAG: diguanylate cyclase [Caldisericia bacterium]
MKLIYSKDELNELEKQIFELKILVPIFGLFVYLTSIFLKFTKYPLTPFLYISIIYSFILILMHFLFQKISEEKFIYWYYLISIIEIFFATLLIYFTGGIASSLFALYIIIILSVSAFRIPNIPFIFAILSYLSYLILVFGEYFKIFKFVDYFSSETIEITLPFIYQRTLIVGMYILLFSLFANRIIVELNRDKKTQDLLRDGTLLLTSYLGDRGKFLTNILKIARELIHADTASIVEYKDGEYRFVAWDKINDDDIKKIEENFKKVKPENLEIIRENKTSLKFDDVWKVSYWVKVTSLRSYIGVPIFYKSKVIAILNVDSRKVRKFNERDIRYLETFSKIISTIYEKDELIKNIKELNLKLENLSMTDSLTNLYNRRKLEEVLKYEINVFLRRDENFQLIMLDVDNFKMINDTLGHIEGDEILIKIGEIFHKNLRKVDFIFRYGGDEFIIIIPNSPPPTVEIVMKRIDSKFKENFKNYIDNYKIGLSYGYLSFKEFFLDIINKYPEKSYDDDFLFFYVLKHVDNLLYSSKKLKHIH